MHEASYNCLSLQLLDPMYHLLSKTVTKISCINGAPGVLGLNARWNVVKESLKAEVEYVWIIT